MNVSEVCLWTWNRQLLLVAARRRGALEKRESVERGRDCGGGAALVDGAGVVMGPVRAHREVPEDYFLVKLVKLFFGDFLGIRIGVWQQQSGKGPRRANGAPVRHCTQPSPSAKGIFLSHLRARLKAAI